MSFTRKSPLKGISGPAPVLNIIKEYCESGNMDCLDGTTFYYIAIYMDESIDTFIDERLMGFPYFLSQKNVTQKLKERLRVGCMDFSYSAEELDCLKAEGKTSLDIAREICNRC